MIALLLWLAMLLQPIVAPCLAPGERAQPVVESWEDGSHVVGAFCAGESDPSVSFTYDPDTRTWSFDRVTGR